MKFNQMIIFAKKKKKKAVASFLRKLFICCMLISLSSLKDNPPPHHPHPHHVGLRQNDYLRLTPELRTWVFRAGISLCLKQHIFMETCLPGCVSAGLDRDKLQTMLWIFKAGKMKEQIFILLEIYGWHKTAPVSWENPVPHTNTGSSL